MEVKNKIAVVTGGASGIGEALVHRLKEEGAKHVVVVDRDGDRAKSVAEAVGGTAASVDVSNDKAIQELVASTEKDIGPIDLFVSNAGYVTLGGLETPNKDIQNMWNVHVMAHVYAARAVVPRMIERGGGYLVNTASAAGLLSQIGSMAYSVTKHAAVSLAEWIQITHGHQGIKVSVLCPQAVQTRIGENSPDRDKMAGGPGVASADGVLSATEAANCVLESIEQERFWVLPHPEVAEYVKRKAGNVDRWLNGMQRWQGRMFPEDGPGEWLMTGGPK